MMARFKEARKFEEMQLGLIAAFFANAEYANKENRMSWEPKDFMPSALAEEHQEQDEMAEMDAEATFDFIKGLNAAMGGKEAVNG